MNLFERKNVSTITYHPFPNICLIYPIRHKNKTKDKRKNMCKVKLKFKRVKMWQCLIQWAKILSEYQMSLDHILRTINR